MKKLIFYLFFIILIFGCYGNLIESGPSVKNMCYIGVDSSIKREYISYANVLTNIFRDYDKLTNSGVTISCQIDLRWIVGNFTRLMDKKIKTIVAEMNTALTEVSKLLPNDVDVIEAIREGDYCAARYQILEHGKISVSEIVPQVYQNNITHAYKLVGFLNTLPNLDEAIYGYRLLLDLMIKNGHLYSTVTSAIAYQVLNVFHTTRSTNEHFIYIRDHLPESYKNFPWNAMIVINNNKANEPLFAPVQDNYKYDTSRRNALTYMTACVSIHCQWKFIPESNGTYFNIKNNQFGEYLYADSNDLSYDNQRRRVFTWKTKDETLDTGRWQLEPIQGSEYFKIKNLYWNEYMFVDTDAFKFPIDRNCRQVFTWRPGGCEEDGCKWKFTRV